MQHFQYCPHYISTVVLYTWKILSTLCEHKLKQLLRHIFKYLLLILSAKISPEHHPIPVKKMSPNWKDEATGSLPHTQSPHIPNLPLTSLRHPAEKSVDPPAGDPCLLFLRLKRASPCTSSRRNLSRGTAYEGETQLGLDCLTRRGEWWEEVDEGGKSSRVAFGGDDGRPSLCQPVVKRDKWSWGRNVGSVHSESSRTGALKCQFRFSCGWADAYIRRFVKMRREKPLHPGFGGTVNRGPGTRAGNSECSCSAKVE